MSNEINVCLLNDSFPPVIDGVANATWNYARIIHAKFGSSVVVTPRYPGEKPDFPFPVIYYPSVQTPVLVDHRMGVPPLSIIQKIKKHPIDIVHCHCPFVSSLIARMLRMYIDAPIIMTYHTKFDIDIAHSLKSELLRTVAKKFVASGSESFDEVWAVSDGAGENLKSIGYNGEYIIMDNGVDFPKGMVSEDIALAVGAEFGLPGALPAGGEADSPVFLYVGRMMWYKNIKLILEGLNKAKAAGAVFRMLFVGGGEELDEIADFARTIGLNDECIFTGPVRDREKLRALFSRTDMLLFPSTYDTSGLVVREAAACGLASLLVRGSAAAEPVADGDNAVLIDEDADSLASAVVSLANNMGKIKTLGQRAMDELYLSWDTAVAGAVDRYRVIIDRHKSASGT